MSEFISSHEAATFGVTFFSSLSKPAQLSIHLTKVMTTGQLASSSKARMATAQPILGRLSGRGNGVSGDRESPLSRRMLTGACSDRGANGWWCDDLSVPRRMLRCSKRRSRTCTATSFTRIPPVQTGSSQKWTTLPSFMSMLCSSRSNDAVSAVSGWSMFRQTAFSAAQSL